MVDSGAVAMGGDGPHHRGAHAGMDLGTNDGQWLFKERDLPMGPVPASTIIEKLGKGELTPDTLVAREDEGRWQHLREFSTFKVHVARAQARLRVLREKEEEERARRRARRTRAAGITAAAVALVALVAGGAWWWVTSRRIGESAEELSELGITVSPPVIALASLSHHLADEAGDYLDVDAPDLPGRPPRPGAGKGKSRGRRPGKGGGRGGRTGGAVASASARPPKSAEPDGLSTAPQYDMAHIQQVLKKQSRTLFPCIKAEVARTGFKGTIPFEFVVTNAGRVGKIWIDNRQLRGTPLEACFQRTMARWRFKPFAGERPTVSQSFTIR